MRVCKEARRWILGLHCALWLSILYSLPIHSRTVTLHIRTQIVTHVHATLHLFESRREAGVKTTQKGWDYVSYVGRWEWVQWRVGCGLRCVHCGQQKRRVVESERDWHSGKGCVLWPMETSRQGKSVQAEHSIATWDWTASQSLVVTPCVWKFTRTSWTKRVPSSVCANFTRDLGHSWLWLWLFLLPTLLKDLSRADCILPLFTEYQSVIH